MFRNANRGKRSLGSTQENGWRFFHTASRKLLLHGIVVICLCGGLAASAHESAPTGTLDEALWEQLSATAQNKGKLMMLIMVWENNDIEIKKGGGGVDGPWQKIPNPLHSGAVIWDIGNPKLCYVTSGGDMRCIDQP